MAELYSERFELALTTALEAHGLRERKAGRGFEVSHVMSVALITADFNLEEDTVIAALLHDTLEDTDLATKIIASRFGMHVLEMVQDVTEPPKGAPWHDRKTRYIEQLQSTPRHGSLAIASADKIHNLSRMTAGIGEQGLSFINAFTADVEDMSWYHQSVLKTLSSRWNHAILDAHRRELDRFISAIGPLSVTP